MLETIKISLTATIMAMFFTVSAYAFLGFGDSDEWKQMDILTKKAIAPIGPTVSLSNVRIKDFNRVEEKEIDVSDGSWTIYSAAYDITLASDNHTPIRVVVWLIGATESTVVSGKLKSSSVSHIQNDFVFGDRDGSNQKFLDAYKRRVQQEDNIGDIIVKLSEHKFIW